MKATLTAPLIAVLGAAGLLFLSSSQAVSGASNKPVGTYLQTFTLPGVGSFTQVLVLNKGGTIVGTDGNDPNNDPAGLGNWRSIGGGQVEIDFLSLDYDATNTLIMINRGNLISDGTSSNPLEESSGTFSFFDPSVDPTDPDAVPLFVADFTATASRLTFPD